MTSQTLSEVYSSSLNHQRWARWNGSVMTEIKPRLTDLFYLKTIQGTSKATALNAHADHDNINDKTH